MRRCFEHVSVAAALVKTRRDVLGLSIHGAPSAFARVQIARTFLQRFVGLLSRSHLAEHAGMLFVPGGGIHTFGMRFAIDVVFLDAQLTVLKIVAAVRPWRCVRAPRRTRYVLELSAGRAAIAGLRADTVIIATNS